MKSISSMEAYAEHYSDEVSSGGEPYRMEACKRRYYDAKNVWQVFQVAPPKMIHVRKRARDTFIEEIQPPYDDREFMSCFFTSLIDMVPMLDCDTRDAFDL